MKRALGILSVAIFLVWSAAAQTGASAQTSGSANVNAQAGQTQASGSAAASNNTSATAGKSGAQAGSSTAATGAASASHSSGERDSSGKQSKEKSQPGSSAGAASSLAEGSTLNAVLSRPVDSRHSKPGDQVMATTTDNVKSGGQVVIPKHSRLIGHVSQSSAKANGDANSSLGIVFDKAILKGGQEVPVHAVVQALAASQASLMTAQSAPEMEPMAPMGAPAGPSGAVARPAGAGGLVGSASGAATGAVSGVAGGAGQTLGTTASAAGNVAGQVAGTATRTGASAMTDSSGRLLASSSGVTGLPGLALQSAASSATQGSVVTSGGKNVHLDSGTQMVLRVVSQ